MYQSIKDRLNEYPLLLDGIEIVAIFALAIIAYFIAKKVLLKSAKKITGKTRTKYDDLLLNENLLKRVSLIVPLIVINQFSTLLPDLDDILSNLSGALTALVVVLIIGSVLSSINDIYESMSRHTKRPIKGYIQIIKIVVYVIGIIVIIGILTGQSIYELLAGIGALTAVLILVFKDTILSFIASIQITSYDLVKVGDWIEVPSYGVDGDVMDIALHTIKVRNFDKTITTVPTHKLIEVSFKNWRGMQEMGGRRIKRSVYIDQSSVKFCNEKMLNNFKKISLLKNYIENKENEIREYNKSVGADESMPINGRRMTNIGTFRAYLKAYLRSRKDIHNELTFLIRQREPGAYGIPIEIYVFTTTTQWVEYEEIQADIFDHILAVVPLFDLKVFQVPTGQDIQSIRSQNKSD